MNDTTTQDSLKLLHPSEFPPLLMEIPGKPKQLYVRGELPSYDLHWLAVVGSRAITNYGRQALEYLISGLAGYPIVIVSGLAYGTDAEAHKAALKAGLPTVAVPGSGLDWEVLYPRANVNLAKEILKSGGALLSEFKPDMKATDYTFPQRNRIMAGLTKATLIIEAKEKSGSLITARLAADFNRDVLVVPGQIFSAESKGIREWGDKPKFTFEPKNHVELMLLNDMADFERGTKVAGFRGYFLKNDGARLVWALERFVEDRFMNSDFIPMIVPSMVRREPFMGTGYLPQSEEDLYKTQDGDYLAGTAEVATMGYYMDEILDKKDLPIKFFSFSPCFRREAGSHGKDTKGIFRIHEFVKYEQVILCEASHEESVKYHEEITSNSEQLLKDLKLPYHVVINCGGDLGLGQVKKYDIEAWMPSEQRYRETHSSSYFHDFQTRRLNTRYRDENGVIRYVHSLNNTALAMPRVLCQIVENYQQSDGTIQIPEVLRPYIGKDIIGKK